MEDKKKWDLLSIASIPLVMTLGNSMLIPVLPIIERELSISSFQASLLITVYSVVAIICIPIAGYISDQIGRKRVIIPSLIIAALGGLLAGFAAWQMESSYWVIMFGRLLQGVGAAGASPIVLPLVGDLFTDEQEVSNGLGVIETSNTFGKVLSPIVGAFLASLLWYLPFLAFPVFCVISIVLIIFLVKSPPKQKDPLAGKEFFLSLKVIFKREGAWLYAVFLIGAICMFILFGVLFYLSTMLEEQYQIEGVKKGIILAIPLAALCIASLSAGKIIGQEKWLMKRMTLTGVSLLTISMLALSFSDDIYFLLTALLSSGIGIGIALPSLDALVTEGIQMEQRGSVTSLYSSMRFVGVAAGPPVFAILMNTTHSLLFLIQAGVGTAAIIIAICFIRPDKGSEPTW
ncbi:MFS transporter [Alkalihalophilus marmarensis]|uniref:MFS transporter n=1 Tax=Alkalihalophilus marmarensis TaxID=521377 RepID=UPI00203D7418|nr:MFS transporter [Alkalihalophilus marmarensis]MCM3491016.1 MFS transporter [Alkalihalophilus marmarensis]